MKTAIDDSNAVITHGELPVVAIHEFQLVQLFQNIISNAIRYRSQTSPVIHIALLSKTLTNAPVPSECEHG
jgi:light-regulated signal transduction histidine kinase (bacteriophytochrome)